MALRATNTNENEGAPVCPDRRAAVGRAAAPCGKVGGRRETCRPGFAGAPSPLLRLAWDPGRHRYLWL